MLKRTLIGAIITAAIAVGSAGMAQNPDDLTTKFRPPLLELNQDVKPLAPLATVIGGVKLNVSPCAVSLNGLIGFTLVVHNDTDRAIVVDTEHAVACVGATKLPAAPATVIDKAACPRELPPYKYEAKAESIVAATATIGAAQFVRDTRIQHGPILRRYGCDEKRRESELCWFGKRIVWPGQSSQGNIYFAVAPLPAHAALQLPVSTVYDDKDTAVMTISL